MIEEPQNDKPVTIRDLYQHMTDKELAVAETNLKRYAVLIMKIHDRLKAEGKSWPPNQIKSRSARVAPGASP